jgi:hypothetical protein
MHYTVPLTVNPTHTQQSPATANITVDDGIISFVSIYFPPGCHYTTRVQVHAGATQLLPANPGESYAANGYAVECNCYFPTEVVGNVITIKGWAVGARYPHTVRVFIEVDYPEEYTG